VTTQPTTATQTKLTQLIMWSKQASFALKAFVVCTSANLVHCAIPEVEQVAAAVAAIDAEIARDVDWIPKLVRLAFHDCVGGCDGCLSFANGDNAGLAPVVTMLDGIYNESAFGMSRADFWAVAGASAVRTASSPAQPVPTISVRYGRTDCPGGSSQYANNADPNTGKFPDAHGDLTHVLDIFETGMGLSKREVVALVGGAHSLGSASPDNSGFAGPWALPQQRFDNGFFQNLINLDYAQVRRTPPVGTRYQWEATAPQNGDGPPPRGPVLMLNADIALYRDISPSAAGVDSACPSDANNCTLASSTSAFVEEFAASDDIFVRDFGVAFTKMIELGAAEGQLKDASLIGASARSAPGVVMAVCVAAALVLREQY
jgi:hypothetical protein